MIAIIFCILLCVGLCLMFGMYGFIAFFILFVLSCIVYFPLKGLSYLAAKKIDCPACKNKIPVKDNVVQCPKCKLRYILNKATLEVERELTD